MECRISQEVLWVISLKGTSEEIKGVIKACRTLRYDARFSPEQRSALCKVSLLLDIPHDPLPVSTVVKDVGRQQAYWGFESDGEVD